MVVAENAEGRSFQMEPAAFHGVEPNPPHSEHAQNVAMGEQQYVAGSLFPHAGNDTIRPRTHVDHRLTARRTVLE